MRSFTASKVIILEAKDSVLEEGDPRGGGGLRRRRGQGRGGGRGSGVWTSLTADDLPGFSLGARVASSVGLLLFAAGVLRAARPPRWAACDLDCGMTCILL